MKRALFFTSLLFTPFAFAQNPIETRVNFTPSEIRLLQDLSSIKLELDREQEALALREKLVDLAESRLDVKITRLEDLESQIGALLKNLSEKEEAELLSLAKIYEQMKPDAAASVMERMDNRIVFDVFKRMNRKSVAKIMEKISSAKGRIISEMLAEKSDLPSFE
jgi:flagellar motility protein MotE (MotC chaperone)